MTLLIDENGLTRLKEEKAWQKLSDEHRAVWEDALRKEMGNLHPFAWVDSFVSEVVGSSGTTLKAGKPFIKALSNAFGVRDPNGEPVRDAEGVLVPDSDLTDYENVPLTESVDDYVAREVLPHVPDAFIDAAYCDKTDKQVGKVGYEINFNRFFYKYVPPRKLHDIDAELKLVESEIAALLAEVATE